MKSQVPELDLNKVSGTSEKLLPGKSSDSAAAAKFPRTIRELFTKRDDLRGLPLRNESECQADHKHVKAMAEISMNLRPELNRLNRQGGGPPFSRGFRQESSYTQGALRSGERVVIGA